MTVVRFLHLAGMAFFVGGQLMLAIAIAPAVRRHGGDEALRSIARRFGIGSAVALAVIIATGIAMASHYGDWDSGVLHAKLALLVLVFVLTGLHTVAPPAPGALLRDARHLARDRLPRRAPRPRLTAPRSAQGIPKLAGAACRTGGQVLSKRVVGETRSAAR
jgi:uncharacterized membrane protein